MLNAFDKSSWKPIVAKLASDLGYNTHELKSGAAEIGDHTPAGGVVFFADRAANMIGVGYPLRAC